MSSIHFDERQLHTTQCATQYDIPGSMWTECCPGLPSSLIWSALKIFRDILNSRRSGVLLPLALMYITYIYRERGGGERERERERQTDRQTWRATCKRSGISFSADCCGQYAPWGIITSCARWEDISETKCPYHNLNSVRRPAFNIAACWS